MPQVVNKMSFFYNNAEGNHCLYLVSSFIVLSSNSPATFIIFCLPTADTVITGKSPGKINKSVVIVKK